MIINPSIQTIVPRVNTFQQRMPCRRRRPLSMPGSGHLCFAVAKSLALITLLFFVSSLWLGSSVSQVSGKIEQVAKQHDELVTANILLRAKKARHFSPEMIGVMATNQLAIHLPASSQYRKM